MRVPIQPSTANPNSMTTLSVIQRRRMAPPLRRSRCSRGSRSADRSCEISGARAPVRVLPGSLVDEYHILVDGLAADLQRIGGKVWCGIADRQAERDGQSRREHTV